jgi:hypothetical protein
MSEQIPQPPKNSKNRSVLIVALVIGLVVGLVLGVFISVLFNLPSSFHKGAGTNNQVQVSGTIQETGIISIQFISLNGNISTSATVTNGVYSVLVIGGQSYNVNLISSTDGWQPNGQWGDIAKTLSLYVPLGVTTFTANF